MSHRRCTVLVLWPEYVPKIFFFCNLILRWQATRPSLRTRKLDFDYSPISEPLKTPQQYTEQQHEPRRVLFRRGSYVVVFFHIFMGGPVVSAHPIYSTLQPSLISYVRLPPHLCAWPGAIGKGELSTTQFSYSAKHDARWWQRWEIT